MSELIKTAIKKNRPHFQKYKKYIQDNIWTTFTVKEQDEENKIKKKTTVDLRKEEFDVQDALVKAIINRLKAFTERNEGDGHLKIYKEFVNETLEIVELHVDRADNYISDSNLSKIKDANVRASEIAFHNHLFNAVSKTDEIITNLRVKEDQAAEGIQWLDTQKATVAMYKTLVKQYPEIQTKMDAMGIDTVSTPPNTIHILNENPPIYNHEKNFFDQDAEVLQYYIWEMMKIDEGVHIDGYFIDGWLYFHFNFFVTNIPKTVIKNGIEENEDEVKVPELRDNEVIITEYFKKSKRDQLMSLLATTRRAAKTTMNASRIYRAQVLNKKQILCAGGTAEDLNHIHNNLDTCINNIHPAFKLYYLAPTEDGRGKAYGIKTKQNKSKITTNVFIINLEGGTKKSKKESLAGFTPDEFILDEAYKFLFKTQLQALEPALWGAGVLRCHVLITGTGGDSDLAKDGVDMLTFPDRNKVCLMDWEYLERKVPKELITWKRRKFGLFLPTQMSVKHKKIKSNLADFLEIESETLSKVVLWTTDWENSKIAEDKERLDKIDDRAAYVRLLAYHPYDPDEIFLSGKMSPFSNVIDEATSHRAHLIESGKWDNRRTLTRDSNGKIECKISTEELIPFPFTGSNQDAPYNIIEPPDNEVNPRYYYVASADFYKQLATTTTDSVCTVYILKFPLLGDKSGGRVVASLATRPNSFSRLNEKIMILLEYYNAVLFPENEDLAVFQTYLETKHLEETYLEKHIDFTGTMQYSDNAARKYGWTPKQSKNKLMGMFINYLEQTIKVENDYGQQVEIKRIQTIDDVHLLSEIIGFNESGNFDRISGILGSVGLLHFLEKSYIYPKGKFQRKEEDNEPIKIQRKLEFFRPPNKKRTFFRKN